MNATPFGGHYNQLIGHLNPVNRVTILRGAVRHYEFYPISPASRALDRFRRLGGEPRDDDIGTVPSPANSLSAAGLDFSGATRRARRLRLGSFRRKGIIGTPDLVTVAVRTVRVPPTAHLVSAVRGLGRASQGTLPKAAVEEYVRVSLPKMRAFASDTSPLARPDLACLGPARR